MTISVKKPKAASIRFDTDNLIVEFTDGRVLYTPLVYFPRLLRASDEQRHEFEISGGGTGLHWDALDEDISVQGLLLGIGDQTSK